LKYFKRTASPPHSTALTTCRHVECQHSNVKHQEPYFVFIGDRQLRLQYGSNIPRKGVDE